MNSCPGCGAILQDTDVQREGYTKDITSEFCERCFRIKHYNDYKKIEKKNDDFFPIIEEIGNTNNLVVLLVDLLNIPEDLETFIKKFNNPILLVLTKRDLLPASLYEDRLMDYFTKLSDNMVDIMIISSMKNYHLDEFMDKVTAYKTSEYVYVVGYTNAGKSTLINKILYNYANRESTITTSILPSTTIQKIEIEINDDLIFVDTPGLLEEGSIIQFIDEELLKKIMPKKEIRPITYQIKEKQFILIEDIARIDLFDENNVTFYLSNSLELSRVWKQPSDNGLKRHDIEIDSKEDLVIAGLGFMKVMKKDKISVYALPEVRVYTRKSLI